ncbi:MAG TPA: asparaginase domain-containing protein [Actinophytocola sp.]|nr:asparaginase domain-containing protein [Actinophytocola sp.]
MAPLLLVATGDTIAHRASSVASGQELLELSGFTATRVVVEDVLAEPSWDTSVSTQLALARRVRTALLDEGFAGVVVTHGIDTLEETAFLTDLLVGPAAARGTVVFTGAARPLSDPTADGPGNLAAALAAAAAKALRGLGVVVCLDDELHAAQLFPGSRPLGLVVAGEPRLTEAPPPRPPRVGSAPETDVALIRTYPGMTPALLTTATDAGARGLVLEGTGAGNVPVELFITIDELTTWDIPVVVASRAPGAGIGLAERIGAISARGLPAGKARMALMAALGDGGGVAAARKWFDTYQAR